MQCLAATRPLKLKLFDDATPAMASSSFKLPVSSLEGGEILKLFTDLMRDKWTGEAVGGRRYVRIRRMIDWMRGNQYNKATVNGDLLLDDVYKAAHTPSSQFRTVEWEQISKDNCIVMFGLLTVLGYGHLIDVFRRHSMQDYLRKTGDIIRQSLLKDHFESTDSLRVFMDAFERRRWEFSPVEFDLGMDIVLEDRRCVLPFCRRQRINHKGTTAKLYEVAVEEDFVQQSFRVSIQGSKYKDIELGPVSIDPLLLRATFLREKGN